MAQDQRLADHVGADATVLIVVDIRATDADRLDLDEHFLRPRLRHRPLFNPDVVGSIKNRCLVRHSSSCSSLAGICCIRQRDRLHTILWEPEAWYETSRIYADGRS